MPKLGDTVEQSIDWETRYNHMRVHSALHLLSVVIPLPVTGGSISDIKGGLDFNMPRSLSDKEELESQLNELIAGGHKITNSWISDEELAAQPGLVKTMSVKPPIGSGRVRLVRIGSDDQQLIYNHAVVLMLLVHQRLDQCALEKLKERQTKQACKYSFC